MASKVRELVQINWWSNPKLFKYDKYLELAVQERKNGTNRAQAKKVASKQDEYFIIQLELPFS